MAYGLAIYNNNNKIQIDGKYENYSLHETGTWSVSGDRFGWYDFTPTTREPIIAIRPPGSYCLAAQYVRDENYNYCSTKVYAENDISLPYIIFTKPSAADIPATSYGLAIYNSYNNIIFHTSKKWCRIVSVNYFNNPLSGNCSGSGSLDVTVNDAYNNYFILRPLCEVAEYISSPDVTAYRSVLMKRISSSEIRVSTYNTGGVNGLRDTYCNSSSNMFLLEINTN